MFSPRFTITPQLTKCLMGIEASRQAVSALPVTVGLLTSLRESARLTATHYSTQIEGNRLTQAQVGDVLNGGTFPARERDEEEVKNYWAALAYVDEVLDEAPPKILEKHIKTIHGMVMGAKKRSTRYRKQQNAIYNSADRSLIYMPPEPPDVPVLMKEMTAWINEQIKTDDLPAPLIAGLAHYQFATIHPYMDGNGRTARLLTNLILHRTGYGLKGIYSLEEYYARDLQAYYDAISVGPSHNYYFGREEADLTDWLSYFCSGMADAFATVHLRTDEAAKVQGSQDQSTRLRELDVRQRQVLTLFRTNRFITTSEIAGLFKVHRRTALHLCHQWVDTGFLLQDGTSKKLRRYELAEDWLDLVR